MGIYSFININNKIIQINNSIRYENSEIALQYGAILRECIKHEQIAKLLLYSQHFYRFFTFVEVANFDVASDAFLSFKVTSLY